MIPIHHGNVVQLVHEQARVVDVIKQGQRLLWRRPAARRDSADKAMTAADISNAKREAEYVARRNGIKAPLLQLWR